MVSAEMLLDVFVLTKCTLGNADGLGSLRREELKGSCRALGIPERNVILHDPQSQLLRFEDDPNKLWDPQRVADTLQNYVNQFKISSVSSLLNLDRMYNSVVYLDCHI